MSVQVELSSMFGLYTENKLNIDVQGKTIKECLNDLVRQFPDLKKVLLNQEGNLQNTYEYYVNGESSFPRDMNKPLKDGDKLNVVYVIHGG
jgi:molybdopterin converting factor small subunit